MIKKILGLVCALGLILGFGIFLAMPAMAATGNTYYVATVASGGSDGNTGLSGSPWLTIQHAINTASSGDTIIVAAGTYTEQLLIQKSLTITGAGQATTIIQAPATRTGYMIFGAYKYDYIVCAAPVSGNINARIEGFTINANNQNKTAGTDYFIGTLFRTVLGANSGLFSCAIQGFPATPEYESYAVQVIGGSSLSLVGNTISSYTRDGILVSGSAVAVTGNNLTGSAVPLQGISLIDGASGSITGNTVQNHTRSGPWAACGILVAAAHNITVTGNTVLNTYYGIFLDDADNCVVSGNTLTNNIKRAVSLDTANNNTISDNTINGPASGTDDTAIGMDNNCAGNMIGGATPAAGNNISMATSGSGTLYAIYMQASVGANNNTIRYNNITGGQRAVQFDGPPGITGTTTISNNTFSGQAWGGITAYNNGNLVVTNNTLTNTVRPLELFGPVNVTITGNTINGATYDAINMGSVSGTKLISANTISNCTSNAIHGQTNADNLVIDGNTISLSTNGIWIENGCTGVIITNNTILNNTFSGITAFEALTTVTGNSIDNCWRGIETSSALVANNNKFTNNAYGSAIFHSNDAHNVTNNWWGAISGPAAFLNGVNLNTYNEDLQVDYIQANNNDNFTFAPWLSSGTDSNPAMAGFQPATGTSFYPVSNGSSGYASIQDAIDAASAGDTLIAIAGTYNEQLIIDKALTLQGSGDTTIIKPSQTTIDNFALFDRFSGSGNVETAIIVVTGVSASGKTVTLKDFKVDASLATGVTSGANMLDGIFYRNSNGTIDNITVVGVNKSGLGEQNGGIRCAGFDGNSIQIEIKNCEVSNYNKNGITCNEANLTVNVHNNTVMGLGSINWSAQNGIQIAFGAKGSISNNTISNHVYTGPSSAWSCGILISQSDGVTISGNNTTHNLVGIYILQSNNCTISGNTVTNSTGDQAGIMVSDRDTTPAATNNTVSGNTISGGWAGIWSSYCSGNTYSNNTLSGCTGNAIYFWDTDSNTLSGNTVTNIHDGGGTGWGIALDGGDTAGSIGSDSNILSDNTINNSDIGIWIGNGSDSNTLESNTINNNLTGVEIGTYGGGAAPVNTEIHFNNIYGNTNYGMNNTTSVQVDATNNWWGAASGPSGAGPGTGNRISTNVIYTPWTGATVEAVITETVTNATVDAVAEADTTVSVTGTATVTVAEYSANPATGSFSGTLGKYIDVQVDDTSGVSQIEIRLYYTEAEIAGQVEFLLRLRWWDGTSWGNLFGYGSKHDQYRRAASLQRLHVGPDKS